MEVTKQWIAKVAGWKANKAGRELFERGSVLESNHKGHIITGILKSGAKPTRVTVKIHSEIDIDTVCPRLQCRRTGEICEHAVALMLHSISSPTTPAAPIPKASEQHTNSANNEPAATNAIALSIHLPPEFTSTGINVRLARPESDCAPTKQDARINHWLTQMTGQAAPGIIRLSGHERMSAFLELIAAHPRIFRAEESMTICKGGPRLPMHLSRDDDRIQLTLCDSVLSGNGSWYAENQFYLWDHTNRQLSILDVRLLWKSRYWQRLAGGDSVYLPIKEFLASLEHQDELVCWDDTSAISEIPITTANPSFELLLDGSTDLINAQLTARYSAQDKLVIGLMNQHQSNFPIPHPEKPHHFLSRNRDAEDEAAGVLLQAGFKILDAKGGWQLSDSDTVLEFLSSTLPGLEKLDHWKVSSSHKLKSLGNNMVRIIPEFEFRETTSSGQDWLAFDVSFKTDQGKEIPKEIIQRMLSAGKRSGTSKNGKQVMISGFDADTVETVLRDTNPRQQNGLYYASKHQAAYLRRLKEHYSKNAQTKPDVSIIEQLPKAIQDTLRPYQEEGIAWLYERAKNEHAALLADDMGLGKTLQTLALIYLLRSQATLAHNSQPDLVVCPTSLLGNWQFEVQKFFPSLKTLILHGPKRKDHFSEAQSADIIITSYALISRDEDFYATQNFGSLVVDEASIIRNPDTQAAKSLCKLNTKHRIALTGTPVENAVRDLWSLYHFLLPGYLGSRKDFQQFYEKPLSGNMPDNAVMKRLRMRVEPFMLRRTKAKVAKDLPPKIHQTIYCEPSASQSKTYAQLLQQGAEKIDLLEDGAARMQILTVLLRLRQASCDLRLLDSEVKLSQDEASSKVTRLLEMLSEAKQGGHRVLVFSQFTTMLGLIKPALDAINISYSYLDGSTKDRTKEVEKFQSTNGPDVFLISLKAGGYGLNLTAADTVIHFDPWWNPAVEAQATDRAYRIGQTKPTTVYKLVTRGTVEEKILKLQEKKQDLISSALGDEANPLMQGLSQSEIASLLQS